MCLPELKNNGAHTGAPLQGVSVACPPYLTEKTAHAGIDNIKANLYIMALIFKGIKLSVIPGVS